MATRPAPTSTTTTDIATVERLSTALNRCFETFEPAAGLFADDAFFDLYPPLWRLQVQGGDAFGDQLRAISGGVSPTVQRLRAAPTATGFVMEHEEAHATEVARRMILCEVRDEQISEVVVYCNGGWDPDLRARHAGEAPMLRPWETAR